MISDQETGSGGVPHPIGGLLAREATSYRRCTSQGDGLPGDGLVFDGRRFQLLDRDIAIKAGRTRAPVRWPPCSPLRSPRTGKCLR